MCVFAAVFDIKHLVLDIFSKLGTYEVDFYLIDSCSSYFWINQTFVKVNSDN